MFCLCACVLACGVFNVFVGCTCDRLCYVVWCVLFMIVLCVCCACLCVRCVLYVRVVCDVLRVVVCFLRLLFVFVCAFEGVFVLGCVCFVCEVPCGVA